MQRPPPAAAISTLSPIPSRIPLARKPSSLVSVSSAPRTPTGGNSPLTFFATNSNRNSTSSWNSSNYDPADGIEYEWRPEQIRLLKRTLDALPAHLLTPFNGPVPPSNLIDKVARGVSKAKGPIEWQHSLRATRSKIVELARMCAKENDCESSDTMAEEEDRRSDVPLQQTTNTGSKRPLYRQSSMDFMQSAKTDIKDNSNIARLSHRLQRTERTVFHPYTRSTRSPSPPLGHFNRGFPSLYPSTPSSSTLNSSLSESRSCRLQRSISSMSSESDPYMLPVVNPRVQRIKRADTFSGSSLYASRSLKRAPSFGASSRNSMESAMSIDSSAKESDVTSSDEEEKLRSKKAKRARTKAVSPTPLHQPLSPLASPAQPSARSQVTPKTLATGSKSNHSSKSNKPLPPKNSFKPRANLQRNPSILGGELPNPQPNLAPPASIASPRETSRIPRLAEGRLTPSTANAAYTRTHIPSVSPQINSPRPHRRRKEPEASRIAPARKISFGSLVAAPDDNAAPAGGRGLGLGLDSAFQMH